MKNLVIASLFFMSVSLYPMKPEEKIVMGGLVTAWVSCFVYELFIKDPTVRAQERQERIKRAGENNCRIARLWELSKTNNVPAGEGS